MSYLGNKWPQARRSLHANCVNCCCNKSCVDMGRYGTKRHNVSSSPNLSRSYSDNGIDEVDQCVNDSSYELQRSCSESTNAIFDVLQSSPNESTSNIQVPSSPDSSTDDLREEVLLEHKSIENERNKLPDSSQQLNGNAVIVFCILVFSLIIGLLKSNTNEEIRTGYNEDYYRKDLQTLMKSYTVEYDSMVEIFSGVKSIILDDDASSFVFIYTDNHPNGKNNAFEFLAELALYTARLLRNETNIEAVPITTTSTELNSKSERDILFEYQSRLNESGVMMIDDLESIRPEQMRPFHYYCDRENPSVKKSALFFMLNENACIKAEGAGGNIYQRAENCLADMWKELPEHSRLPLITRVTNIVIDLGSIGIKH